MLQFQINSGPEPTANVVQASQGSTPMGASACSVLILLLHTYRTKAEVNSTGFNLRCPSSSLSHAGPPCLPKSPSALSPLTLTALSAKLPTLWNFFFPSHCNWNDFIQHRSDQVILCLSNSSKWLPLPSENGGIPYCNGVKKEMATHSSILAWKFRATVHGFARVGYNLATKPPPPAYWTRPPLPTALSEMCVPAPAGLCGSWDVACSQPQFF